MSYTNNKLIAREDAILDYYVRTLGILEKEIAKALEETKESANCPNCGPRCFQNAKGRVIKDTHCDNCEWCGTSTK